MPSTTTNRTGDDARLRRHLAVLFPGYAGDRNALLETLGVEELSRAFKRLALEYHPDRRRSGDAEMERLARDQFERAREAYEALRDHATLRASGAATQVAEAAEPAGTPLAPAAGPCLIAVGGAKGGVGKSTLAGSLATAVAMLGHRVAAVDLDLGGANLHLFLGVRAPARTLAHFWGEGGTELADLCVPTEVPGLSLVAGDSSTLGASNIGHFQKQRLLRHLRKLPTDVVVVDLGGDTTFNTLDFLLHADERLIVTTEDPAAVLDAYNLVKVGLLRSLVQYLTGARKRPAFTPDAEACCDRFVTGCTRPDGPTLPAFLAELWSLDAGAGAAVERVIAEFRPRLVLNHAGPTGGKAVIERIREVCRQHLRIDADLCHVVPADPQVPQATRRLGNVVSARLDGEGAQAIWAIAHKLVRTRAGSAVPTGRPLVQTRFFQPPWVFPLLARALADLTVGPAAGRNLLHAWHVGAGTGEGPYSLAIALDEAGRQAAAFPHHVWATGAQDEEIAQARRGVYPLIFVEGLRPETLRRYFLRGTGLSAGLCSVKETLREQVSFLPGAATLDPLVPHGPADLLFLDVTAEAFAVMSRSATGRDLGTHLRPGGLLVVPAWPRADLPITGFTRVADGIFARAASAASRTRIA